MGRVRWYLSSAAILTAMILFIYDQIIVSLYPSINRFSWGIYLLSFLLDVLFWSTVQWILAFTGRLKILFSCFVGAVFSFCVMTGAVLHREFREYLTPYMIKFIKDDPESIKNYIQTYGQGPWLIVFIILSLLISLLWIKRKWPQSIVNSYQRRHLALALLSLGLTVVLANQLRIHGKNYRLTLSASVLVSSYKAFKLDWANKSLYASKRATLVPSHLPPGQKAPNIMLFINESWDRRFLEAYAASSQTMPFLNQWMKSHPTEFVVFTRAFANAGATDVSVPSLMTGVGSHESSGKLHHMPLIWDWAKSAGYWTMLVSSQRFSWNKFDHFFFSPGPDAYLTADQMDAPIVNDIGIDDLEAAARFLTLMAAAPQERPWLAIFNSNAMHTPFQQTSSHLPKSPAFTHPAENASFILDQVFSTIYNGVKTLGHLDNTMFIFTADHGLGGVPHQNIPRLFSFYDDVLNIPFVIRMPPRWIEQNPEKFSTLKRNAIRNISNLDIVPTAAVLSGASENLLNRRYLENLEGKPLIDVVSEDRVIISLNSNDTKKLDYEGFGIIVENKRFVFSTLEKQKYFNTTVDPEERDDIWDHVPNGEREHILGIIDKQFHLRRIYAGKQ